MIKVSIIGSGNVAQHLIKAFTESQNMGNAELFQVFSRHKDNVAHLVADDKIVTDFNFLEEADLYIIAVSDNAIADVSSQLPFKNRLVVHTSGSVSLNDLDTDNRKGVFYPLQTFSKNKPVDFSVIPICLESENATDFQLLETVAKGISDAVFAINSEQRQALHVAAVFVNNFVNHLYQIGSEICQENQVLFDILKPLIQETAEKILTLTPADAQTGPAKRNDSSTIATHLAFLTDENRKAIYQLLTQSIQNNGQEL